MLARRPESHAHAPHDTPTPQPPKLGPSARDSEKAARLMLGRGEQPTLAQREGVVPASRCRSTDKHHGRGASSHGANPPLPVLRRGEKKLRQGGGERRAGRSLLRGALGAVEHRALDALLEIRRGVRVHAVRLVAEQGAASVFELLALVSILPY